MFNLANTEFYNKLLNSINIRGQVYVGNKEIAQDFKRYAKMTRGLELSIVEENNNHILQPVHMA